MGPLAIAVAGISLAVGAVGAYQSYEARKQQAKFNKQAAAAQRAQDNMKAARERREAIRNARLASGTITQNAANQGVSGSSAALGGLGSIESQLNQGLSFLDGFNRLSDQAGRAMTKANKAGVTAEGWGAVSGLGMQVFGMAGQFAKVKK